MKSVIIHLLTFLDRLLCLEESFKPFGRLAGLYLNYWYDNITGLYFCYLGLLVYFLVGRPEIRFYMNICSSKEQESSTANYVPFCLVLSNIKLLYKSIILIDHRQP